MEKNKITYTIFKYLLSPIFLLYYRPKFTNTNLIPKDGPIIVCGNHVHLYDQCLPIISTNRMLHYMAKKEYFDSKMAFFFKLSGCISVDRENHGGTSKEIAKGILNNGYALGIYPEGTRNSIVSKKDKFDELYEFVKDDIKKNKFKKILKKNMTRVSQIDLLYKLKDLNKITLEEFKKYIYDADESLKMLIKGRVITKDEYLDSLLLPIKYGTVSLASKTDSYVVPYAIKGKYKLFNNNLEVVFSKPFKVKDIEKDNQKLRREIIRLISK